MLMETSDLVELLAKNLTDSSSVKLVKRFLHIESLEFGVCRFVYSKVHLAYSAVPT